MREERLRILYKITERKNGKIFKTEKIGAVWRPVEWECPENETWAYPNEQEIKANGGFSMRIVR